MAHIYSNKNRSLWLTIFGSAVLFFLVVPSIIVIPMSFSGSSYLEFPPTSYSLRWYETYFSSEVWMSSTGTSLLAAFLTTIIAMPLGTLCAYGLYCSSARVRNAGQILIILPITIPVILIGVGIFNIYAKVGLNYTLPGVVLAHLAMALPFVIITVLSGLHNHDLNQELAARSLGASRAYAFWTVTVPQVRYSIQTGAFLAFIISLDEVVISMLVSGGEYATVTRRMFNSLRDQLDPTIAAISTCLITVSVLALVVVQMMGKRKDNL